MAKKTKAKKVAGEEILAGDSRKKYRTNGNGKEPKMPFEADFGEVSLSDLDKILNVPGIDDMAGIFVRGNFKSDEERIAYLRLTRRLKKFKLTSRLEFIRECVSSKLGMMAFGKTLQLQSKIELIAPAVIREQLSMRALKAREDAVRGSDFRQESEDKEPRKE